MLKERNKNYNAINFIDISSDDYSPEDNQGLDYETVRYFNTRFIVMVLCDISSFY